MAPVKPPASTWSLDLWFLMKVKWNSMANLSENSRYSNARAGLSYLPQEPSIFRRMTVAENIQVALDAQSLSAPERSERLESLLEEFHIQHIRDSYGYSLSGSE